MLTKNEYQAKSNVLGKYTPWILELWRKLLVNLLKLAKTKHIMSRYLNYISLN